MADEIAGGVLGGIFGIANSAINNAAAAWRTKQDRLYNYLYNEKAAENADQRTRNLYNDFYSPQALLKQYNQAGLSPSMMFGGTPGQGGMSGAQGSGTAGLQTPYMPYSILEAAQIANIMAQTKNVEADTELKQEEAKNINTDTQIKELQKSITKLEKEMKDRENDRDYVAFFMSNKLIKGEDGKLKSMFEIAESYDTYHGFMEHLRQSAKNSGNKEFAMWLNSELGNQHLRQIYIEAKEYKPELQVLTSAAVNAKFQASIVQALEKVDYKEWNAKAAIDQLKAAAATNELTQNQKNAWNRLINKLGNGKWYTDLLVILGMMLGGTVSNNIKISTGENHITVNKNED